MTMHKYIRGNLKAPKTTAPVSVGKDSLVKDTDYTVDAPGSLGDENRSPVSGKKK